MDNVTRVQVKKAGKDKDIVQQEQARNNNEVRQMNTA